MNLLDALEDVMPMEQTGADQRKVELLVLDYNKEAMKNLGNNNLPACLELLKKAETSLFKEYKQNRNEITYRLIGITLNNLGCYYKKTNKPKVALDYLKKALQVEVYTLHDKLNIASTHLNICAILSSLAQHNEAIKHAKLALGLLESERSHYLLTAVSGNDSKADAKAMNQVLGDKYKNIITTMIMAYFNYGIELEHIRDFENGLKALTTGFELATRELGPSHALTNNICQNIHKLVEKKKEADGKNNKRNDYLSKVAVQANNMTSNPDKRPDFLSQEKPRKAVSVNRLSNRSSIPKPKPRPKPKAKPPAKGIQQYVNKEMLFSKDTNLSVLQDKRIVLPEIKQNQRDIRERKPPSNHARGQSSSFMHQSEDLNSSSLNMQPRVFARDNNTKSPILGSRGNSRQKHSNNAAKPNYQPILDQEDSQYMGSDIESLDDQISKLQNEIELIADDSEPPISTKETSQRHKPPLHYRGHSQGRKKMIESFEDDPSEYNAPMWENHNSSFLNNQYYGLAEKPVEHEKRHEPRSALEIGARDYDQRVNPVREYDSFMGDKHQAINNDIYFEAKENSFNQNNVLDERKRVFSPIEPEHKPVGESFRRKGNKTIESRNQNKEKISNYMNYFD